MLRIVLVLACIAMPLAGASSALAGDRTEAVEALRAGQFIWFDDARLTPASTGSDVSIIVSLPDQRAYIYRGDSLIGATTVSTGKPGKETPVGDFTILQKKTFHRSNLYSNAPMPFMQRLTWDGIALHAGHLPGYPASHGCIRMPAAFAKQLYQLTEMGGYVSVVDYPIFDPFDGAPTPPMIAADTASLNIEGYDMVTMSNAQPASLIEAVQREPVSWVTGPVREIVQPLPSRGSR